MDNERVEIQFSTRNDGQWGKDTTDDQARLLAGNCRQLALAYADTFLPESFPFEVTVTPGSARNDDHEVVDTIMEYIGRHWCEEDLWSKDFDAEAYVKANPR